MKARPWRKTVERLLQSETFALLAILALQLVLSAPRLMPSYSQINAYDEAKYIESGRLLLSGELRSLAWGPLVSLVYAPLHLLLGNSLDWFVVEARAGQLLLFSGMWLATIYLSRKIGGTSLGFIAAGVLFVSTSYYEVVNNQSDALFICFSALALAKVISFSQSESLSDIWQGSAFVGLACLSRIEAIIYLPVFLGLLLVLSRDRTTLPRLGLSALLPAIAAIALFLVASIFASGEPSLGLSGKSYDSFEVNQPLPGGGGSNEQQRQRSIELFGTQQENDSSVIRAILRNPPAFLERIWLNASILPAFYFDNFGARLGAAFILLALAGITVLFRTSQRSISTALVAWALPPAVSLMFLPLHYVPQVSFIILVLAAVGIQSITSAQKRAEGRWLLFAALLVGLFGILTGRLGLLVAGVVLSSAIGFSHLLAWRQRSLSFRSGSLLMMLAAGLILRPAFRFPDFPAIGKTESEQAVHYLQRALPLGASILEPLPLPAVAAKLLPRSPEDIPLAIDNPRALHDWLETRQIAAIYVAGDAGYSDRLLDIILEGVGETWSLGFQSDSDDLKIYLVK